MDVVGDALDEFEDKWGNIFVDKNVHLALLLLGKEIGGGMASGAGMAAEICPGFFAGLGEHAVCSDVVNHKLTFPPVQGKNTWPFRHIAHEIGHNLGGIHTHENGLDECDEGDPAKCPEGTIMS